MTRFAKREIVGVALALIGAFSSPIWGASAGPADAAQEETFLGVLPKIEVPDDVQPIPGAMNEEFRNCRASWPAEFEQAQSGPEARALRDIYGYVQARNVVATLDCGCAGKVANWEDVEAVAAALRDHHDVEKLSWQQTKAIAEEAATLTAVAETICGGSF